MAAFSGTAPQYRTILRTGTLGTLELVGGGMSLTVTVLGLEVGVSRDNERSDGSHGRAPSPAPGRLSGMIGVCKLSSRHDLPPRVLRFNEEHAQPVSDSPVKFEIIGDLRDVQTIATGRQIRVLALLRKKWGPGRWRKMKGSARVRILVTGNILEAEIHWYEAHGVGRRDFKIKKLLR